MKEIRTIVARDDMHTLRSVHFEPHGPEEDDWSVLAAVTQRENARDFDAELRQWSEALKAQLTARGWPPFCIGIEDHGDGIWRHDPDSSVETLMARWKEGEKFSLTRGERFIGQRVEKLSDDYFRWRLCRLIERALHETDVNQKLFSAVELGRVEEIWKTRRAFRKGYEAGRKSIEGGKKGTAERKAALAPEIEHRLARMEHLVSEGHTISRAAELAARDDFGDSKEANRRLWHRHRGK